MTEHDDVTAACRYLASPRSRHARAARFLLRDVQVRPASLASASARPALGAKAA